MLSRAYNQISLNLENNTLIKTSNTPRLKDEIGYYQSLPPDLKRFFATYYDSQSDKEPFKLELEYYNYKDLGELSVHEYLDLSACKGVCQQIKYVLNQFSQHVFEYSEFVDHKKMMYVDKTESELLNLTNSVEIFNKLESGNKIVFNGENLKPFRLIWGEIKELIKKYLLIKGRAGVIHGDMCFANILYVGSPPDQFKTLKFIDPRGSFGAKGYVGDSIYDLAKLRHSVYGRYEFIIRDAFKLTENDNSFCLTYDPSPSHENLILAFEELLAGVEAQIVEGLIFIGMCARHNDSLNRQKAMYLTGLKILNNLL